MVIIVPVLVAEDAMVVDDPRLKTLRHGEGLHTVRVLGPKL